MRVQRRLDLGGIDVHAARDDHVDLPVADVVVAIGVAICDVADREVAVVEAAARRVRTLVVLGQPRVPDHELTGGAVGHIATLGVDEPDLLSRHGGAA